MRRRFSVFTMCLHFNREEFFEVFTVFSKNMKFKDHCVEVGWRTLTRVICKTAEMANNFELLRLCLWGLFCSYRSVLVPVSIMVVLFVVQNWSVAIVWLSNQLFWKISHFQVGLHCCHFLRRQHFQGGRFSWKFSSVAKFTVESKSSRKWFDGDDNANE